MIVRLIWNDIKQNKLLTGATVFFMAVSAMLLALTVLLFSNLTGAIDGAMTRAQVPDYMQMHAAEPVSAEYGDALWEPEEAKISLFAESREEVRDWQVCRFLNLDNSRIMLGGISLADSTQDNGLSVQGERFDYLLDMENNMPEVLPGEIYVPVCYRALYNLSVGDTMVFGDPAESGNREFVIAGFLRDAQMNSMMASSKRFLVNEADYESMRRQKNVQEEYLIEFLLHDQADANVFGTAYAAAGLPANGPAITKTLIRQISALSDGTMIFVIFLVSIIVLLISMLCIRFMLSLQMERSRKEAGMLKALGVGKKEIRRIYFSKYILLSVCGASAGLLSASFLKHPLEEQIQELYGTAAGGPETVVPAFASVLFVEGLILLSVRHFLKKTDKLSALEALFSVQEKKTGRGQYFMIGFVAAACAFLVLVPQNLYNTMSAPGFVTYMGIGDSEIRMDVRRTEDINGATEGIAALLEQDMRVEKYAVLRTVSCTAVLADGNRINLPVETGGHDIFPVSFTEGKLPEGEKEIALSSMNAEELGLAVGDGLRILSGGKEVSYTVCGIYSDITNGGKTAKADSWDEGGPVIWSVLYVSLKDFADKEQWIAEYREMGADVTDMADYVQSAYGQTLEQLHLASKVAYGVAISVIAVVVMLFMRLIIEKNRYSVSLHKALGFTGADMKCTYFIKGIFPVIAGIAAGLLLGSLCGESLCGMILKSFGADTFRFVAEPAEVFLMLPALLLIPSAAAVRAGIAEIRNVRAYECCRGQE